LSEPCCEEFGIAKNYKKLIVVYKDLISSISDVAPNDYNGAVLMYVGNQNQGLPPNDIEFIAKEIFKAIRGSYPSAASVTAPASPPSSAAVAAQLSTVTIANREVIDAANKKYGDKPLTTAAEKEDTETVIALVGAGYKDLDEKDEYGCTALIWAADKGHEGCVEALLAAGANTDVQNYVSRGDDPLMMADDPSHGDSQYGKTALMKAACNGHEGCVKTLLAVGANKDAQDTVSRGDDPLMMADDPSHGDSQGGNTALIYAALYGREECVKTLLDAGANKDAEDTVSRGDDPLIMVDDPSHGDSQGGDTALILAAWKGHEGCVKLLVEAGADRSIKTKQGLTALDCASTEAIKAILRS